MIETSKQFNNKHPNGIGLGSGFIGSGSKQRPGNSILSSSLHKTNCRSQFSLGQQAHNLNFDPNLGSTRVTGSQSLHSPRARAIDGLEHCAFDNPYFRDDAFNQSRIDTNGWIRASDDDNNNMATDDIIRNNNRKGSNDNDEDEDDLANVGQDNPNLLAMVKQQKAKKQIEQNQDHSMNNVIQSDCKREPLHHSIAYHISNLHSRQITSSVKQLSLTGQLLHLFSLTHSL